jgi:hypothetical protein
MRKFLIAGFIWMSFYISPVIRGQAMSWYRSYSGTIGTYPVTFHLHKAGPSISGYYYYQSKMQPIYLIGDDTSAAGGKITLYGAISEVFTLTKTDKTCTGIWKKESESKTSLPVKLVEKNITDLEFDLVYTSGSLKLKPKMEGSPEASYDAVSIWPKGSSATASFIRQIVNEEFGEKNSTRDIGKIFLQEKKKFFDSYLEENKETDDSLLLEYPMSYNMEGSQRFGIAFLSPKLLTLAGFYYSYTGGAHGNFSTHYVSIDLVANKKLNLADVLMATGIKKLNSLLEKYFRKDQGLGPAEDLTEGGLFENKIEANENFYVTPKGIGFSFAPYEIAPYAAGEINIYIPFSELTPYLQPGFKKLLQ